LTTTIIVAAVVAVLAVAVAIALYVRRRRPEAPESRRDAPSAAAPAAAPTAATSTDMGEGLVATRRALGRRLGALLRRTTDDSFWDELEEALIAADVGVGAASAVVGRVRGRRPGDAAEARHALGEELRAALTTADRRLHRAGRPAVIVIVGVNGSGKTTTIGKLAARLEAEGVPTLLGAADTFRAAAAEQLSVWAARLGIDVVAGSEGADPAAVAFDALSAARARHKGAVIIDTAGRLHSKHNLMQELGKVARVLEREAGPIDEVLLVLDGTIGQNGIAQARAFTEAVGVTGIVITKLDGTARGGVAVAVEQDLGIPVKFVGLGEKVEDLIPFDPDDYVDALLGGS
jgi:fused signal recognition particle receptor